MLNSNLNMCPRSTESKTAPSQYLDVHNMCVYVWTSNFNPLINMSLCQCCFYYYNPVVQLRIWVVIAQAVILLSSTVLAIMCFCVFIWSLISFNIFIFNNFINNTIIILTIVLEFWFVSHWVYRLFLVISLY